MRSSLVNYVRDVYPTMPSDKQYKLVRALTRMISGWGAINAVNQGDFLKEAVRQIRHQFSDQPKVFTIEWDFSNKERDKATIQTAAEKHVRSFAKEYGSLFGIDKAEQMMDEILVFDKDGKSSTVRSRLNLTVVSEKKLRRTSSSLGRRNGTLGVSYTRYLVNV